MELSPGWEKISPSDGHYFFGYYDRNPWNADESLHLALKAPQAERLPLPGESAEVGVIEAATGSFHRLATTRAWCHQQGSMTLWLTHRPDCFIFNDWDVEEKRMVARVCSVGGGIVDSYSRPIYAMSPDGRWGASLDFARIPRRGYSYADAVLDTSPADLENDGIFVVDMQTGASHLLVSYGQMFERHPARHCTEGRHSWLNHIIFNCDSTKLLFLLRHCVNARVEPWPWQTHMYTVELTGEDLACTLPDFYWRQGISHQMWGRSPHEILIDANWQGKGSEYVVFDETIRPLRAERISTGLGPMGHLIFSPDGKWMLADTYSVDGEQRLGRLDMATAELKVIGRFRHVQPKEYPGDVRCDLHPRWNSEGSVVTVDSIHDGMRGIYCLRL